MRMLPATCRRARPSQHDSSRRTLIFAPDGRVLVVAVHGGETEFEERAGRFAVLPPPPPICRTRPKMRLLCTTTPSASVRDQIAEYRPAARQGRVLGSGSFRQAKCSGSHPSSSVPPLSTRSLPCTMRFDGPLPAGWSCPYAASRVEPSRTTRLPRTITRPELTLQTPSMSTGPVYLPDRTPGASRRTGAAVSPAKPLRAEQTRTQRAAGRRR